MRLPGATKFRPDRDTLLQESPPRYQALSFHQLLAPNTLHAGQKKEVIPSPPLIRGEKDIDSSTRKVTLGAGYQPVFSFIEHKLFLLNKEAEISMQVGSTLRPIPHSGED